MRHELFPGAVSPTVAIFYVPTYPLLENKLVYGVPKPSPLSQHLKAIILDSTEVKFLSQKELLDKPYLWKIALWGSPRDAGLIKRLKTITQLSEQISKHQLIMGEGIEINGGDENSAPWLEGASLVPTDRLRPYFIDMSVCETIRHKVFHRPRISELTKAPLALIHQSLCSAAFSNQDVAYRDNISGIAGKEGQEWLLYWLIAYINSPLAKYYHFLTSTSWAVERDTIIQWEYEEMPFLIPNQDDPSLREILNHLNEIKILLDKDTSFFDRDIEVELRDHKNSVNELVYDLYKLHPVERQLIEDMLEYGIGFFNWSNKKNRKSQESKAVQRPHIEMLETYAQTFIRTVTSFLRIKNQTLNATVYQNGTPLTVVSFAIVDSTQAEPVQLTTQSDAMRSKLRELDEFLLERKTPSMYIRRHVRVYDGNQISLVRPSEQRFWTQSQARADADAFLAELSA